MESLLLPILLVLVGLFMWNQIRKQRRTAAAAQEMRNSLAPGTRVQTTSGIFATVVSAGNGMIDLETSPGVVSRWLAPAVREVLTDETAALTYPGGPFENPVVPDGLEGLDGADADGVSLDKPPTEHDDDSIDGDLPDPDDEPGSNGDAPGAGPTLEK